MTKSTKIESSQKRNSLKLLKTAGVSSAVIAAMGSSWTRPVVNQVILPAHACTTDCCGELQLSVDVQRCSGDLPVFIDISTTNQYAVRILATPTLSVSPSPNDWEVKTAEPVPVDLGPGDSYRVEIAGSVENQDTCWPPMTDVPNGDPQLVTAINLTVNYMCFISKEESTRTYDILSMMSAPT